MALIVKRAEAAYDLRREPGAWTGHRGRRPDGADGEGLPSSFSAGRLLGTCSSSAGARPRLAAEAAARSRNGPGLRLWRASFVLGGGMRPTLPVLFKAGCLVRERAVIVPSGGYVVDEYKWLTNGRSSTRSCRMARPPVVITAT